VADEGYLENKATDPKNQQGSEVMVRNEYYRDGFHKIFLALLVSVILNLISVYSVYYVYQHPPEPVYFATSANGRIMPLIPLNEPNSSDGVILQWANLATVAAYSYNFVNYRNELQSASEFFTAEGWSTFLDALKESNNLEAVISKKLVVTAVATRAPVILQKGVLSGRYSWRIQIPILVTYQSASEFSQQNLVVTMLVTRISTLNNPKGVGIAQFVSAPYSGDTG
jgi:intracellular multiplication protein IcmL